MSGNDGPENDDLEERARKHNSTLQSLIEAVGSLLAASRELLGRLQIYGPKNPSSDPGAAPDGDKPAERHNDNPQQRKAAAAPGGTT